MPSRHRIASKALRTLLRASAPVPVSRVVAARTIASTSRSASCLRLRVRSDVASGPRSFWPPAVRKWYTSAPKPASAKMWSFEELETATQNPDSTVVIVDAREPGELTATGRIPGAINIPVTSSPDGFFLPDEDFEDRFGFVRPARDAEIVFYCKSGVRSRAAAGLAREAGWTNVAEYPGSWLDWAGKGGAVEH